MASFQKRGKTWQYTISHKPNPIRKSGFKTKKEAMIAAAEIESKVLKGVNLITNKVYFVDYFEMWIHDYKRGKIAEKTLDRYYHSLRTIKDYFGDKLINSITMRDYQRFLNEFAETHAKETTRKLNNHIKACVRRALNEGALSSDFTLDSVATGQIEAKSSEEKFINYDEAQKLLESCYERLELSIGYSMIILALTSGMRYAELAGLTRDDFSFTKNEIRVNKTWDYRIGTFGKTKTETSNRIIKMDERTMLLFKDIFSSTPNNIFKLVFFSPSSKYKVLTNGAVNKLLRKTLIRLDIDPVTMHALRHTHASILLYQRASVPYVSERLGHKSIDTTLRHYTHVLKELRAEDENNAIKTFEKMLG